jgi:hypothetical protein
VWMWLTDWFLTAPLPATFGRVLYVGYATMLMGAFTQILPLQASVICFGYLLLSIPYWQAESLESDRLRSWKAAGSFAGFRQRLRGAQ